MKIKNFFSSVTTKFYLTFFVGYFFLRNIFMPLCYDDYAYAFIWDGEHGGNLDAMEIGERQRVENFSDIFISQISHYFTWGGRIIGHSLAQFFIWVGKISFDVANTIVLIIFILTILNFAGIKFRDGKFAIVWIFFNLFFVSAIFGQTVIWMTWLTGTCNYFWLTVLQLIFLLQYVKIIRGEKIFIPKILIFPLSIISGWATEAGSLATVFLTAIFILMARRKKFLKKWMLAGFFGVILGCALNIFSPGNFAQMEFIQSVNPNFKFSAELLKNHIFNAFLPIILIDLFALLPAIYYRGKNFFVRAFAAAGFLIPCAMLFSPKFELRVTILSLIFILVASTIAIAEMKKFDFESKKICAGLMTILFLYFSSSIYENFLICRETSRQIEFIQKNREENLIFLPRFNLPPILKKIHREDSPPINSFAGIIDNENYCINVMVAQYYGAEKVISH